MRSKGAYIYVQLIKYRPVYGLQRSTPKIVECMVPNILLIKGRVMNMARNNFTEIIDKKLARIKIITVLLRQHKRTKSRDNDARSTGREFTQCKQKPDLTNDSFDVQTSFEYTPVKPAQSFLSHSRKITWPRGHEE